MRWRLRNGSLPICVLMLGLSIAWGQTPTPTPCTDGATCVCAFPAECGQTLPDAENWPMFLSSDAVPCFYDEYGSRSQWYTIDLPAWMALTVTVSDDDLQRGVGVAVYDVCGPEGSLLEQACGQPQASVVHDNASWDAVTLRVLGTVSGVSNPGTASFACEAIPSPTPTPTPVPVPGTLKLSASSYPVNEGGGSLTITVQRVNGRDGAVSVQYATSDGTAKAGSDYTQTSGTLNWADQDDANKTFAVPITNDTITELSETFTVTLSNPGGGATLGSPSQATVTITDNDPLSCDGDASNNPVN